MDSGKLLVQLRLDGGRIAAVSARSTRPAAARLLVGKTPEQALALIPLLFSLCGRAQRAVAAAAIGAARGQEQGQPGAQLRPMRLEAAQEHLWRLLLDWPLALGLPPLAPEFAGWHKRLAAAGADPAADPALAADLADFLAAKVFARPATDWAEQGDEPAADASLAGRLLAALAAREPPPAGAAPALLPLLPAAAWADLLRSAVPGFDQQPLWHGVPAETGALARHAEHRRVARRLRAGDALSARLLARLLDLAAMPARLAAAEGAVDACSPAPGAGVAVVDTARGQLVHSLRIMAGRVADYVVVAPTEWNFHPQGAGLSGLTGLPVADGRDAEARVRLRLLALDPCVPFETGVVDA